MYRKYFSIAYIRLIETFQYRAEMLIWQLIESIPAITFTIIILQMPDNQIGGLDKSHLVMYYLLTIIVSRFIGYYFTDHQAKLIRTGEFSKFLLIPVQYHLGLLASSLIKYAYQFLFIILPLYVTLVSFYSGSIVWPKFQNFLIFLLFILVGNIINFILQTIIVSLAFFFKTVEGLKHALWVCNAVFGGAMLPIYFLPSWLQNFSNLLPFKFFYHIPISFYLGLLEFDQIGLYLFQAFCWLGLLILISTTIWKYGLRKYSAVGG